MTVVWDNIVPTTWQATRDFGDGPRKVAWVHYAENGLPGWPAGWIWDTAASAVGGDQHSERTWPTAKEAMDDCSLELAG